MNEPTLPPEPGDEDRPRVRWWFPAMFAVSVVAAAIAIFAYVQRGDGADPDDAAGTTSTEIPDLSALGTNSPEVEDPAPPFSVPIIGGGTFSLADHLADDGRPVVLNLWASWCGPCRAEMPAIDEAAGIHTDVLFVGVAVKDALSDAASFAEEIGVDYLLAYDESNEVDDQYTPLGLPATFFIDSNGGITLRHFGPLTVELIAEQLEEAFGG